MIKLRTKFLFVSMFSLICSNFSNSDAAERDYGLEKFNFFNKKFGTQQNVRVDEIIPYKNKGNRIMSVNFRPIDSLANSLSMGNDNQTPIAKDPTTKTMALVMRGSHEVTETDFGRSNSKNNLFLKQSTDDGLTWSTKELIYTNEDLAYGQARYPSCFVLNKGTAANPDVEILYTFSLVIETTGQWPGFATGLYGSIGNSSIPQAEFTQGGKTYKWGRAFINETTGQPGWSIADSRITGWYDNTTSTNIFCTGPVTVTPAGDPTDNSAVGYRHINEDLGTTKEAIPAQWSSAVFAPTSDIGSRTSVPGQIKRLSNGTMYQSVFGNFGQNPLTSGKNTFGVSMSSDNGATWSELELFPWDYVKSYIIGLGQVIAVDSVSLPYWSNDFVVHENGDYSFTSLLVEFDASKPRVERLSQIVELYRENGEYGVRLVADNVPHTWVPYTDNAGAQAGNAKSYELQTVMTADGKTLISKWVELIGIEWPTDDSFRFMTSDVFVSKREVGSNTWSPKTNITNDDMLDRTVWLPNILPNDLTQVPIFSVQTKGASDVANQRLYLASQLIMAGTFDATNLNTSVERDENLVEDFNIYPNPTNNDAIITYNLVENSNVKIIVTDYLGNELITKSIDNQNSGINFYTANLSSFANGAYFVSVYANGKLVDTKSLNVIR